jgi:hypothetical protein
MRVAYLTTDEVNERLAQEFAIGCGVALCPLAPKEEPPDGEYDAVLYDLDSLPVERQREVMAALLAGPLPRAVAVHGYNMEDDQVEALRRRTVAVYRILQPRVFRFLRLAVISVRAARALGRKGDDGRTAS